MHARSAPQPSIAGPGSVFRRLRSGLPVMTSSCGAPAAGGSLAMTNSAACRSVFFLADAGAAAASSDKNNSAGRVTKRSVAPPGLRLQPAMRSPSPRLSLERLVGERERLVDDREALGE